MLDDLLFDEYQQAKAMFADSPWGPFVDSVNAARLLLVQGKMYPDGSTVDDVRRIWVTKKNDEPSIEEHVDLIEKHNREHGSGEPLADFLSRSIDEMKKDLDAK